MVSLTYCHSVLDCCFISGFSGKRVGGGKGGGGKVEGGGRRGEVGGRRGEVGGKRGRGGRVEEVGG